MKLFYLILFSFFIHSSQALAIDTDLPGNHILKQNEQGEYFVENEDEFIMIEPLILQIGSSEHWIVACIKNESIDTDLKRMVFINLKWGGTTDSINQENWLYFKEKLKGLSVVKLEPLAEEECP